MAQKAPEEVTPVEIHFPHKGFPRPGEAFCSFPLNKKSRLNFLNSTCLVVAGAGFEPTTFGL
jgi:hypothetical protein